jgi:hypothetical protein
VFPLALNLKPSLLLGCKAGFIAGAVLLCFATQPLQIAVEWLRQGSSLVRLRAEYSCVSAMYSAAATAVLLSHLTSLKKT